MNDMSNPRHALFMAVAFALAINFAAVADHTTTIKTLSLDGARQAIAGAVAQAKANHATGVFAVVDNGGSLIALERLDNTFPAAANISIGKARTAAIFKKPTKFFEGVIKDGRTAMTALPDFTPLQGGVPITIDGQIVGAIGVSGASSAQQDEEFAIAGANAVMQSQTSKSMATETAIAPGETLHLRSENVSAAFAKGMPLVENQQFKVHASRREMPGEAEVHQCDTDIIHVLEGSATFVTGGTVDTGKLIAAGEIRGTMIRDGQTQTLHKGDVIVVPHGTPHWFKDVNGPLLYYVVKVTTAPHAPAIAAQAHSH
jgi:uncharacterized protein GlcG (DUF336 family)